MNLGKANLFNPVEKYFAYSHWKPKAMNVFLLVIDIVFIYHSVILVNLSLMNEMRGYGSSRHQSNSWFYEHPKLKVIEKDCWIKTYASFAASETGVYCRFY